MPDQEFLDQWKFQNGLIQLFAGTRENPLDDFILILNLFRSTFNKISP